MDKKKLLGKLYLSFSILVSILIAILYVSSFVSDYSKYTKLKERPKIDTSAFDKYDFSGLEKIGESKDFDEEHLISFTPAPEIAFPKESLVYMLASLSLPGVFFYFLKRWFRWLTT
jgi:hypothetical protein